MKKRTIILLNVLVILILAIIIIEPMPYLTQKAKLRTKALWNPKYRDILGSSWQWKCFDDMNKIKRKGYYFDAIKTFEEAYARMPEDLRLSSHETMDALLSITAELMRTLPDNSFIIASGADIYPFRFLQRVEGVREDITLIDEALWHSRKYRKFLWKYTPVRGVISRDSLLILPDSNASGDRSTGFSLFAQLLTRSFPVFIRSRRSDVFDPQNLYWMPLIGNFYSAQPLSDSIHAVFTYKIFSKINCNYFTEHPPFDSRENYSNTHAAIIGPSIIRTIDMLRATDNDSLARRILKRFDSWMSWDPNYLLARTQLAMKMGDDPTIWFELSRKWIMENNHNWAVKEIHKNMNNIAASIKDIDRFPKKNVDSARSARKHGRRKR